MRRWSDVGEVFDPHTTYRMTVLTRVHVKGDGPMADYPERILSLAEVAYFRTEGPPGLTSLTEPTPAVPQTATAPAFAQTQGGLADLTAYVRQTVPATVAGPGEKPLLPRPVYRAYDVGVEYNANYVDLMYRMSRRDLGVYLFDNGNSPARDVHGRLAAPINHWGRTETVNLSEVDKFWLNRKNDACAPLNTLTIKTDLTLGVEGLVLAGRHAVRGCVVRIWSTTISACRSTRSPTRGRGSRIRAPVRIGGWTKLDEEPIPLIDVARFSAWEVVRSEDQLHLAETRAAYGLGDDAKPRRSPPVLRRHGAREAVRVDRLPDEPGASGRCHPSPVGSVGVAFRVQPDPSGLGKHSYFLFHLSNGPGPLYRRLAQVNKGDYVLIVEDPVGFQLGDQQVVVEAIGASLRVYLGDDLLFRTEQSENDLLVFRGDEPPVVLKDRAADVWLTGTVGLWAWRNKEARFSDVRVDDLRRDAPILYRFQFTTSRFTNFFHHVHSYRDETFRLVLAEDLRAALAQHASAPEGPMTLEETQAYDVIAGKVMGPEAVQFPQTLEVTQVEREAGEATEIDTLLVRSPEPIDWKRTGITLLGSGMSVPIAAPPGDVKLTGVTLAPATGVANDERVELLVREAGVDLDGRVIEYRSASVEEPWQPFYRFGDDEKTLAAGTRIFVHGGKQADGPATSAEIERRFAEHDAPPVLPVEGVDLRLSGGHALAVPPDGTFTPLPLMVVRKADGGRALPRVPSARGGRCRGGAGVPVVPQPSTASC